MERYTRFARWYDALSGEPVYRAGRLVAVPALGLRPGDRVLDVGCGTGLNLPLLLAAVGPAGQVVGVDRSPQMLAVARRRTRGEVLLVEADATRLDPHLPGLLPGFDAVLSTYALSLMPEWRQAWSSAVGLLRPGGRAAVVDLHPPTGRARLAAPAARLACWMGGADIAARPWTALEEELGDVRRWSLRGGHVQVRVATKPPDDGDVGPIPARS